MVPRPMTPKFDPLMRDPSKPQRRARTHVTRPDAKLFAEERGELLVPERHHPGGARSLTRAAVSTQVLAPGRRSTSS